VTSAGVRGVSTTARRLITASPRSTPPPVSPSTGHEDVTKRRR
jgi:hypothetical protein